MTDKQSSDTVTETTDIKTEENTPNLKCPRSLKKSIVGGLLLCGVVTSTMWYTQRDVLRSPEFTLETFQTLPERDVVVVDRSIADYDEELAEFIDGHTGVEGLHVYRNDEGETYALVSGREGMEPLTLMLYGVVEGQDDSFVIGYNYVEASPLFRHELPLMLLRIDADADAEISGRIVQNDEYKPYHDILARYEEEGFEPLTQEEIDALDEEVWQELFNDELSMEEDLEVIDADISELDEEAEEG